MRNSKLGLGRSNISRDEPIPSSSSCKYKSTSFMTYLCFSTFDIVWAKATFHDMSSPMTSLYFPHRSKGFEGWPNMSMVTNNERNCFGLKEIDASDKQLSHSMSLSCKPYAVAVYLNVLSSTLSRDILRSSKLVAPGMWWRRMHK